MKIGTFGWFVRRLASFVPRIEVSRHEWPGYRRVAAFRCPLHRDCELQVLEKAGGEITTSCDVSREMQDRGDREGQQS